jgi:hypothetical protein
MNDLTRTQQDLAKDVRSLDELEGVIERGQQTFMEVGEALLTIKERRLYREAGFDTFDAYCQKRWGFGKRRANQVLAAAEVGTMVPGLNERQARALAPIRHDPELMREVVEQAMADGVITGRVLAQIVEREERNYQLLCRALELVRQLPRNPDEIDEKTKAVLRQVLDRLKEISERSKQAKVKP